MKLQTELTVDLSDLDRLRTDARQAVIRGTARAIQPIRQQLIANARRVSTRTGALGRSITTETQVTAQGVMTTIGVDRQVAQTAGVISRGPARGQSRVIRPHKYAWLVERGTHRSRAKPFMKPTFDQVAENFPDRAASEIRRELGT